MIGNNKNLSSFCSKANWLNFLIFWIIYFRLFEGCLGIIDNRYNFGQETKICDYISMLDSKIINKPIQFNNFCYDYTPFFNCIFIDLWFISENPIFLIIHKNILGYTPNRHSSRRKISLNMFILLGYIIDKQWMIWIMYQLFVKINSLC